MQQRPDAIGTERTVHPDDPACHLVGESAAIEEVRSLIRYASATHIPVMITGPSGCGKEVVARALHRCSARQDNKFVGVNCGAIPRDLLESELFGHEKGSFTGAIAQRKGRFEIASSGTLFLDEIGDMPFDMQVKLLRVLEEKQIERIGGTQSISIDARIISATHQNLDQAIVDKRFREDLFYRLSVFPIDIPPLKDRPEDIGPLIRHFLKQINAESDDASDAGSDVIHFTAEAMHALEAYAWPGNARELRNIVERAVLLFPGMMISAQQVATLFRRRASTAPTSQEDAMPSSFPTVGTPPNPVKAVNPDRQFLDDGSLADGFDLKQHLMDEERKYLLSALKMAEGVVAEAAGLVSMRRTTFVEKMRRHNIQRYMALGDPATLHANAIQSAANS